LSHKLRREDKVVFHIPSIQGSSENLSTATGVEGNASIRQRSFIKRKTRLLLLRRITILIWIHQQETTGKDSKSNSSLKKTFCMVEELNESKLGTKEYWDSVYDKELDNFQDFGDKASVFVVLTPSTG
jgi:hypothetical protein